MATRVISMPEELVNFVEAQAFKRDDRNGDEFVCDLIRREQARLHLKEMILEGMNSSIAGEADDGYFEGLRQRAMGGK